ncbi:21631_t:CDS:2, partial [Cetraspora pellucida]
FCIDIATQLKNKNPFILKHHCISYKLALDAKDVAKQDEEFKQYKKTVYNIYSYFSRSPEHMMHLRIIEKDLDGVEPFWRTHLCKYMNDYNIIAEELPIIITKFAYASIKSLEKISKLNSS